MPRKVRGGEERSGERHHVELFYDPDNSLLSSAGCIINNSSNYHINQAHQNHFGQNSVFLQLTIAGWNDRAVDVCIDSIAVIRVILCVADYVISSAKSTEKVLGECVITLQE